MTTIKFIADKLYGGYQPILDFYNENKPLGAEPLGRCLTAEGGFEIKLNPEELKQHLEHMPRFSTFTDYNDTVKQLRFTGDSKLTSGGYMGFNKEETELLFRALQHSLGADQVMYI
jgi:hypothetical protein